MQALMATAPPSCRREMAQADVQFPQRNLGSQHRVRCQLTIAANAISYPP
jgi:hypothetical protein